jgi:hypothetical protein
VNGVARHLKPVVLKANPLPLSSFSVQNWLLILTQTKIDSEGENGFLFSPIARMSDIPATKQNSRRKA